MVSVDTDMILHLAQLTMNSEVSVDIRFVPSDTHDQTLEALCGKTRYDLVQHGTEVRQTATDPIPISLEINLLLSRLQAIWK